jgi:alpha-glucosidase
MYFNKIHQPENFAFPAARDVRSEALTVGGEAFRHDLEHLGEGVFRFRVSHRRWPKQLSDAELDTGFDAEAPAECSITGRHGLVLGEPGGKALLRSEPGRLFGVSGQAWMMGFAYDPSMRFYGLGEKYFGFEHSHKRTKFWNTDVWADFDGNVFVNGAPDPAYLSVPYLIVKRGNRYVGVLINNPYASFVSLNPKVRIADQADAADGDDDPRFFIGAPDGRPEVYFLVGPSLAELTRKLQRLVGTTPRPPLWALGHQQCRWGYESYRDLDRIDKQFRKHKIPNDGLWLDIDYMTGYRVFTWNQKHWNDPAKQVADLQSRGQRVVPIFDPGVKLDPKYHAYKSGKRADIFCRNPAGGDYVGFVWPGTTVFPDFSLPEGRDWWAKQVARTVKAVSITGAWLDMNDPATGLSENSEMLFRRGKLPHAAYHNQYALGMAKASFEGMRAAHPDERPFLLTRSGYTSIGRYAAAWTGDNFSNTHHLKNSIPTTLNLALSGVPFNGPDVPGFGGEPTPQLAAAWYKAGFLFPFLRNHSNKGFSEQEPWTFGAATMRTIRRYIRLRYKLLPYLYNLFVEQEAQGEAILRPLLHDFADKPSLPLDRVDDQFMVGPSLMQAPVLDEHANKRSVVLPAGRWFDAMRGRWLAGGRRVGVTTKPDATPLYLRDGAVVPMRPGDPADNATDLLDIELHLLLSPGFRGAARYVYTADDGRGYGYRRGEQTRVTFEARRQRGKLSVRVVGEDYGFGPLRVRFVVYQNTKELTLRAGTARRGIALTPASVTLTGDKLRVMRSRAVVLGK